jgi:hypothetical protein
MARKRNAFKHLDYQSVEYWNRLLAADGLALDVGRHPNLILIGTSAELEIVEKMEYGKRDGRVRPEGAGPDSFEQQGSDKK